MIEKLDKRYNVYTIKIRSMNERDLKKISDELGLSLSVDEMIRLRAYFNNIGRDPTDVELQAIGQAWSEHCCYKSSKFVLKKYITGIKARQVILTGEDAAVVEFDKDHAYVFKMESHNHPSAVEPYGGAATGIGGIIRDVLCMGAKPLALVDSIFFGNLDFPYDSLPKGVKHPFYLFNGVVAGIRDYGNRVGIPNVAGITYFDNRFINNIVVNAGCVGIAKKNNIIRSMVDRVNYNLVLVGGKTGRDGIHGVTFASKVFKTDENVERTAVQLGNPIIKEPLIHAVLEAVDKKLIYGMKDLGGGGLSSVVGEMCLAGGVGAEVHLDKVPLKEKDLSPWEIWISESQERMMLSVSDENLNELMDIFSLWDLDATIIGKTIRDERLVLYYKDLKVMDLDTHFITSGPVYCRPYIIKYPAQKREDFIPPEPNYNKIFLKMLEHPNIASKAYVVRQYDHEVKGNTVLKPLVGVIGKETHGDASIIKPLEDSFRGIAITSTSNPKFTSIDPYWGAVSIVDEAVRNLVSVNAIPSSFADNLNFGNPENPKVMGDLYEVARGLSDAARFLNIPYVSGNVSLYNETNGESIPPTPTLMAIGIVKDIRKAVTSDLKEPGNSIYVLNETLQEMGGSIYFDLLNCVSTIVPRVNLEKLKKSSKLLLNAMDKKIVKSSHDISEGGISIALAEMSIGGDLGIEVDLKGIGNLRPDFKLFSESNTRWVVEVKNGHEKEFEKMFSGLNIYKIGHVLDSDDFRIFDGKRTLINQNVEKIRKHWGMFPKEESP